MKRQRNVNLLLMLVLLVAVGQMAQTIYIPAIADMAHDLNVREGAVQSVMAAYLLTYGVSQLFYGPLADRIGRRPVILAGMTIFMLATVIAITTHSLTVLILASALQGVGTGVGGVMARTLPRDLYAGTELRHANSLLNMGILVSPLLAPLIGGVLNTLVNWRACFVFLLALCAVVTFSMARWMPETRPTEAPRMRLMDSYKVLFGNTAFNCYLLMLIGGLAGIAVFEASSGVLMGGVLGLNSMTVSILFILPIPAAFFGAWFAGRQNKRFSSLMWQSVISCLAAGLMMWIPGWFGVMTIWTLLVPAALFFFGAGMLFPLATSGAMEPFPFLAGTAGALVGGLQNIGSGGLAWLSAQLPQNGQFSLGMLMTLAALLILLCWLPLASRSARHEQMI
ncbi:MFS transporter, DHA1 family, 2-module integral membrane pump EmrD [Kosakonia oryzendophytica]|uniref:MFS transporter, DHA1 family, 2-module integral membrane pump EmrD n=1 Tax=Kosakonia oryzendophytica TaxID=1005665 RepID=A0A1C4E030_9ENTR|nr:multidrug efflux MFS transporter EmrD [Kosakonia oryzendophytica]AMO46451.1 Multidrug MFS integral membrane transporter [Enterobacter sp. FY-07]TDT51802.1 DHA1 family 2-module integral membrane pump EmrD-like MFS transporter [Enterobacter sp. AG5470]WBT58247.1 multidrug efflux MFS transporter EmrD [Kosakonia oryzendophytica]SCC36987.1 MFS transporter, DHA1 family, 2-module integral membrane pump EmrD [Kosakonia oryzendophytica]